MEPVAADRAYRALDSTGQTLGSFDGEARCCCRQTLSGKDMEASGNALPRVMNVDKNPAYPAAVEALKADGRLPRRIQLRQCQ